MEQRERAGLPCDWTVDRDAAAQCEFMSPSPAAFHIVGVKGVLTDVTLSETMMMRSELKLGETERRRRRW